MPARKKLTVDESTEISAAIEDREPFMEAKTLEGGVPVTYQFFEVPNDKSPGGHDLYAIVKDFGKPATIALKNDDIQFTAPIKINLYEGRNGHECQLVCKDGNLITRNYEFGQADAVSVFISPVAPETSIPADAFNGIPLPTKGGWSDSVDELNARLMLANEKKESVSAVVAEPEPLPFVVEDVPSVSEVKVEKLIEEEPMPLDILLEETLTSPPEFIIEKIESESEAVTAVVVDDLTEEEMLEAVVVESAVPAQPEPAPVQPEPVPAAPPPPAAPAQPQPAPAPPPPPAQPYSVGGGGAGLQQPAEPAPLQERFVPTPKTFLDFVKDQKEFIQDKTNPGIFAKTSNGSTLTVDKNSAIVNPVNEKSAEELAQIAIKMLEAMRDDPNCQGKMKITGTKEEQEIIKKALVGAIAEYNVGKPADKLLDADKLLGSTAAAPSAPATEKPAEPEPEAPRGMKKS